ncbi:MAG: lipopolysaccharide biosynthesis protein [Flavobacteriaceae bacterium]
MTLKNKLVSGGIFLGITNVVSQITSVGLNIVLAKLLFAEDFGLIALTTTFIGFIIMVFNVGFGSAIIHYKESSRRQISTLYLLNYFIALLTFVIVYISSPFAAEYYNSPQLDSLIKWCSLTLLINPVFLTHYKILERDLEFKKISQIVIYSTILSAALSIWAAFNGFGVYALVIQTLAIVFFKLIFTLVFSRWKPLLYFNLREVKHMIWYAVKYRVSMGFLYFERNIDYLILGKFFNSSTLGYYSFSYNVMYTPVKRISNIFADVLFPSLSSIKKDTKQIIEIYFKSMQIIGMISFPLMTLVSLNADWIVLSIFGEKWLGAIPILQILCFAGAIQSISQFGTVVLDSIGKPELSLYVSFFRGLVTVLAIVIGAQYGVIMVAYLILITKVLGWLIVLFIIRLKIHFQFNILFGYLKGIFLSILLLLLIDYIFENGLKINISGKYKLIYHTIIISVAIWFFYKSILKLLFKSLMKKIK